MAILGLSGTLGTIIWIVAVICAIWVIYDVLAKNKKLKDTEKLVWIICAVLFSIITAIVYWIIKKK